MNRAPLSQPNELHDDHRPAPEYWGPVVSLDAAGERQDALPASALPDTIERPARCLVCQHDQLTALGVIYGYPLYCCTSCDVGFVWPQPDGELLQRYYGPAYWSTYMNDTRTLYERQPVCDQIFRRQAQCFDRLMNGKHDARILDVGAGDGTMLKLLQELGYRHAVGFDLNAANCQRAQERLQVNVQQLDFLSFQETGWDAITLWAVIEHLQSPRLFVEHAYQLLKPGGLLLMMTGDNASSCAWLQRCFDMWLYPPEHLVFFGKRSLRQLFRGAGFQHVVVRIGYQHWLKEQVLTAMRLIDSAKRMVRTSTRPHWRSTASNLLVAWGRKANSPGC